MEKLLTPENEAEALALKGLLEEHGIPAVVRSFHDSAFDGIFQQKYGWGVLLVPAGDLERAREIVAAWRKAAPGEHELPWREEK